MFEYRSGYFLANPPSKSLAVFERLRAAYPQSVAGQRVLAVRDLGTGLDTAQPGAVALEWGGAGQGASKQLTGVLHVPAWAAAQHEVA